jgi:WD40 repeat protein
MYRLRTVLIALLALSMSETWLVAEEPQPGKVRLGHWLKNPDENLVGFSADGHLLLAGDNYLRIWNPKSGKEDARITFTFGKPSSFNFVISPDGKTAAVMPYLVKEIRLFDVASGKLISHIPQPCDVRYVVFAPDGKTLISSSGGVRLWDVKTGKELWRLRLQFPEKAPLPVHDKLGSHYWENDHRLAFSPDGKTLAVGLKDSSVHLCNAATGVEIRRLFRPVSWCRIPCTAFSPDGHYLAAHAFEKFAEPRICMNRFVIRLWDVRSGELVREFKQPIPPPPYEKTPIMTVEDLEWFNNKYGRDSSDLAFSPDGKTVGNCSSVSQLWEVASGQLRHEFDSNTYGYGGRFSPDGRLLAAGGWSKTSDGNVKRTGIRLWDWRDPCLKQTKSLDPSDIERLWSDLASTDAAVGYRTLATLLAHPQPALAALGQRLRRVEPLGAGEVDRLMAELDDASFSVRRRATERLAVLGKLALPALLRVKTQRPSLEVRRRVEDLLAPCAQTEGGPEVLRCLRAVEVLETIGTEEAQRVIKKLAGGAAGAVQTEDAKAALQRLNRK